MLDKVQATGRVRQGAGCMILCRKTGRFLMCLRAMTTPHPGTWAPWGGKKEEEETQIETALREVFEETSHRLDCDLEHIHHFDDNGFEFDTFLAVVEEEFMPFLTAEADGFCWVPLEHIPSPQHPGLTDMLNSYVSRKLLVRAVENQSGRACSF